MPEPGGSPPTTIWVDDFGLGEDDGDDIGLGDADVGAGPLSTDDGLGDDFGLEDFGGDFSGWMTRTAPLPRVRARTSAMPIPPLTR